MIASGDQNQLPSSYAPLGDLLKALMFLLNLKGFNSSPSPPDQGFVKQKSTSKVWKEKVFKWFYHFFLSLLLVFVCITCVFCFIILSQSNFMFCFVFIKCVFGCFFLVLIYFLSYKNKKIEKLKNTKIVCVLCTLVLVYLGWPLKHSFLNFVSFIT